MHYHGQMDYLCQSHNMVHLVFQIYYSFYKDWPSFGDLVGCKQLGTAGPGGLEYNINLSLGSLCNLVSFQQLYPS